VPVASFTSFIGDHGIYAVFALMAIDAVFPAASELVMVYAGAIASGAIAHHVSLFGSHISTETWAYVAMALAGTLGYLLGSIAGWAIGVYGGRPLLERHGRWLHVTPAALDRAERWFERWGAWGVFLGRLTPVVRSFISIPAGVFRAPLASYTALTLLGSAIWCFGIAGAGWALGAGYHTFHKDFRYVDYLIPALVLVGLAAFLLKRRSTRLGRRAGSAR
jgi:membrane protein DedA with SNARE-associated domain